MKLKQDTYKYISGDLFSNGLSIKFDLDSEDFLLKSRQDFLLKKSKNMSILHIGCVDHLPLINEKIKNNKWLHALLCKTASNVCGVDINQKGIEYLKNELNYDNVFCLNMIDDNLNREIISQSFDYAILGEILEHVDNPVLFLSELRMKLKENTRRILITIPNAFSIINILKIFRNQEIINTDHRYWFTPFTISKVCHQSGMKVEEISLVDPFFSKRQFFKRLIIKYFPLFRETIIVEVSLGD